MSENNFKFFDRYLSENLPEECTEKLKSFYSCKIAHNQALIEENGQDYLAKYNEKPLSRTEGCKDTWESFYVCRQQFIDKLIMLNNYAVLKGDQTMLGKYVFSENIKQDGAVNFTHNNFGLNKF
jgi:hypothetical protein